MSGIGDYYSIDAILCEETVWYTLISPFRIFAQYEGPFGGGDILASLYPHGHAVLDPISL